MQRDKSIVMSIIFMDVPLKSLWKVAPLRKGELEHWNFQHFHGLAAKLRCPPTLATQLGRDARYALHWCDIVAVRIGILVA